MNIKSGRYRITEPATAGSTSRFRIGDAAFLPDSDAGTDLEGCFRAGAVRPVRREKKEAGTVSMKTALTVIAVVLCVFGSVTCARYMAVRRAENDVERKIRRIEETRSLNARLSKQRDTARDLSRIGYLAVTRLGMVASDEGNTVVMYVPQVEAFAGTLEKETAAESESTPPAAEEAEPLMAAENGRTGG